jgi:hypothetical protein
VTAQIHDPQAHVARPRGWAYLVVPGCLSGLLFLIAFPLILRLNGGDFRAATDQSESPYLWRWLALSGGLFLVSAACYAWRLRRGRQRPR